MTKSSNRIGVGVSCLHHMRGEENPIDPTLIFYCPLAGDYNDYSGLGNNLISPASPLFATIDRREVMEVISDANATSFDAIPLIEYVNNFRIEFEINRISINSPAFQYIVGSGMIAGSNGFDLFRSGNQILFRMSNGTQSPLLSVANTNVLANKWYKFVIENKLGILKMEIIDVEDMNVVVERILEGFETIISSTNENIYIGAATLSNRYANAYLRNFKLYKYGN